MTGPAIGAPADGAPAEGSDRPEEIERWEAALAAARRFLESPACAGCPDRPESELRECLRGCLEHLTAVVAASSPSVPLARTVDEAAAALGVSPITVYRLVNDGNLAAYRISGRRIRIDETALRAFLASRIIGPGGVTSSDIPARHLPQWR